MKSKVYFTKTITPEKVLEMYELLGKPLTGKVAAKVHSGEPPLHRQRYRNSSTLHPSICDTVLPISLRSIKQKLSTALFWLQRRVWYLYVFTIIFL